MPLTPSAVSPTLSRMISEWTTVTARLKEEARRLGFSMAGVVAAVPSPRLAAYEQWLAQQMQGEMGYMGRPDRVARRRDLQLVLPAVQTMLCVGLDYHTLRVPPALAADPSRGRIASYAWGADYHDVMTPRLQKLGAWLTAEAHKLGYAQAVAHKAYVDTGALLERDHAASAGLGFTGKNTMLIAPQHGSWFFLGELLTTLPLVPDVSRPLPSCGRCTRCLSACPTQAFPEPYVLDARRCISYLTIELKGWIPPELRPLMGNWVYGCDVCQTVCPFNRFAAEEPAAVEPAFHAANWEAAVPPLLSLLTLTAAEFDQRFAHSPIKRIKWGRLLRNACVAAGNWGQEAAVPALCQLLHHSEAIVRGHAAWALGRIGARAGLAAVATAVASEADTVAQGEMAAVVG